MADRKDDTVVRTAIVAAIVLCTALTALAFAALVAEVRAPQASALPLVMTSISDAPARPSAPTRADPWVHDRFQPSMRSAVGTDAVVAAEVQNGSIAVLAVQGYAPVTVPPRAGSRDDGHPTPTPPSTTSTTASQTGGDPPTTPTTLSRTSLGDRTPPTPSAPPPSTVTSTTSLRTVVTPTTEWDHDEDDAQTEHDEVRELIRPPLRDAGGPDGDG